MFDDIRTPLLQLLKQYKQECGTNDRGAVRDLLIQIMHEVEILGIPFEEVLEDALDIYYEEKRLS